MSSSAPPIPATVTGESSVFVSLHCRIGKERSDEIAALLSEIDHKGAKGLEVHVMRFGETWRGTRKFFGEIRRVARKLSSCTGWMRRSTLSISKEA